MSPRPSFCHLQKVTAWPFQSPAGWGCSVCTGHTQKQPFQTKHFPLLIQSYMQEGLSPNHLKKAKLMFFYTRYPSSNMLKTYFSDVKVRKSLPLHVLTACCVGSQGSLVFSEVSGVSECAKT